MSLQDLHKTALLIMRRGDGLLPGWYLSEMVKRKVDTDFRQPPEERHGYGWQFWRTRAGYAMYGMGGQLAIICPQQRMVLCTTADTRLNPNGVQRLYDAFFEELYPYAAQADVPALHYDRQMDSLPQQQGHPEARDGVYTFPPNMLGLVSMALSGEQLHIHNARGKGTLTFGFGCNAHGSFPGWPGTPSLASGAWLSGGRLRLRCYAVGDTPCGIELLLSFKGNSLTVQASRSNSYLTEGYEGVASGYLT